MKRFRSCLKMALAGLILTACRVPTANTTPEWIRPIESFEAYREVRDLLFSPDSHTLFSASGNFFAGNIQSWDIATGDPSNFYHDYSGAVMAITMTPDGQNLISASQDGNIRIWDVSTAEVSRVLTGTESPLRSVALNPHGSQLASGSRDGTIRLWNSLSHSLEATWTHHQVDVSGLAFSNDGRWLASSDGLALAVWDSDAGEPVSPLPQDFPDQIYGLAFSPVNTAWLAFGSEAGKVYLWNIVTQTAVRMFQAGSGYLLWDVAFNPAGDLLAAANSDGTVVIWAVETGEQVAALPAGTGGISAVAYSADGRYLAAGGTDKTVQVWEIVG